MRGNKVQGRFKIDYETMSMDEGIVDELRDPVGTEVNWWLWDDAALAADYDTFVDPVYDVSNQEEGKGRRWVEPFKLPVIMAQQLRGTNIMNERGYYTTDTLRLVVAVADINRLLPAMITDPAQHIKDRVVFHDTVFVPTRVLPRGLYKERYSVVTIDCNQVNAEELVNDPQFQSLPYQSPATVNTNNAYGLDGYGTGAYGS
jgi:hypothetical protein